MIRDMFKSLLFSDARLDQRSHEEMVAQLTLKLHKDGSALKKGELDAFYESNFNVAPEIQKKVKEILTATAKMVKASFTNSDSTFSKNKFNRGKLHNLWDVIRIIEHQNDYKIQDYKGMFTWFLEKDAEFTNKSKKVTEEDRHELSYTYWTKTYNNSTFYRKTQHIFERAFLEEVQELVAAGIVKKVRTGQHSFTWKQKLELYIEQGKVDRKNVPITALELYANPPLIEAGHVISFKNGGEAIVPNGELQRKSDNRSQGSKDLQPHFDYQQPETSQ